MILLTVGHTKVVPQSIIGIVGIRPNVELVFQLGSHGFHLGQVPRFEMTLKNEISPLSLLTGVVVRNGADAYLVMITRL